jgi:hypothetical protein
MYEYGILKSVKVILRRGMEHKGEQWMEGIKLE